MKKFLIFDIDHTLSTFDDKAGMTELRKYLISRFDKSLAQKICSFMDRCYAAFVARARGEDSLDTHKLEELIKDAAQDIGGIENFSDIHWSRELWIYLAAGGSLSPAMCVKAAECFWRAVTRNSIWYKDSLEFFDWLHRRNRRDPGELPEQKWRVVFVTSSDARLKANHENTALVYDPEHSGKKKMKRVQLTTFWLGGQSPVYIGDPVSKPHPEFWQRVIRQIGYNAEIDLAIMTGDSYRVDVSSVSQFGIVPVLIDREGKTKPEEVPEARYVIRNMAKLSEILSKEERAK